jgi:hemolysin activation/secretion protein
MQARLVYRQTRSYLDDEELDIQHRETTSAELSLMHQRNIGDTLFDASISVRQGLHWLGATDDTRPHSAGDPTNFFTILTADATLQIPFQIRSLRANVLSSLRGQATGERLFGAELFTIGNRYTVRGFDGQKTLGAEKGVAWRNEAGVALAQSGQTFYVALDYGYVSGQSAAYLPGHHLLGGAIGLRGGWKNFYYDTTFGIPLFQPKGFHAADVAVTFQAGVKF